MLNQGDLVTAAVVRIEPYGAYLQHDGLMILVLGPDASSTGETPVEEVFKIDQDVRVRIGHFNEVDNLYRGFIPSV
jgi:ribosomal protein S1